MTTQDNESSKSRSFVGAFLVGAWMNRRHTRLVSSIVIGLVMAAGVVALGIARLSGAGSIAELTMFIAFAVLNLLFFPAAREVYFRFTAPLRAGLEGLYVFGPLLALSFLVRLVVFLALWMFAIPLGIVASLYLGLNEVFGGGWRMAR